MNAPDVRNYWSRVLITLGNIAMLVGAIDLLEGSLLILPGSALAALGTFFSQKDRRWFSYRVGVFTLVAIGVMSMWILSSMGGFGGNSGRSPWWSLVVMPYLVGWSMGIWGPGSPRWLLALGIVMGVFFEVIVAKVLTAPVQRRTNLDSVMFVIAALGVVTIVGCIHRLTHRCQDRSTGP